MWVYTEKMTRAERTKHKEALRGVETAIRFHCGGNDTPEELQLINRLRKAKDILVDALLNDFFQEGEVK